MSQNPEALLPEENKQEEAERKQREAAARERGRLASLRDFSADNQWLVDNGKEYAGQWVALRYGELIAIAPMPKRYLLRRETQDISTF